jgi:hypothetical protein
MSVTEAFGIAEEDVFEDLLRTSLPASQSPPQAVIRSMSGIVAPNEQDSLAQGVG